MQTYITSFLLLLVSFTLYGQQNKIKKKQAFDHSFRLGIDVSKPIISLFEPENKGVELLADFRFKKNFYIAAEIGFSDKNTEEDYFQFNTKGSFVRVGANINVYKNWLGMDNEIYTGLRYGFSMFDQTVNQYTIFQEGFYINNTTVNQGLKFNNLNAHWVELVFGIKVEMFKNLFLATSIQFKKMITTKEPENFKNLYVPGFNKVYKNDTGIGFNYAVLYRIPF